MSNLNNQYGGSNNANSYNYNISNKLESYNNIDSMIDQTPKKVYNQFSLGINSSHLVNNDKENSFIKANHDNYNDMNYMDHQQNNYQIPSNYGYNNNHHNTMNPHQHSYLGQHQMDHYNSYQYTSYGFYYPQQPYYGYDYANGHNYPHYLDPQQYNQSYYNNYYSKTPTTGPKIQQNIILQKSENKFTGQANQQAADEFGNKKDDFQVRNLFQQVVISEFQPNENESQQNAANQNKQNSNTGTSNVIMLSKGKSSKSKSSMEQESEQQQLEESAKKSKITPSKRISKKKSKSTKQTPTNQCSSIQDSEETFSCKNSLQQSQFANASIAFNKALNSEQSSENMILEEEEHVTKQEKDIQKLVRRDSQNTVNRKAPRISNASSMISSTTTKIIDENNNINQLNIHQQISQDQINSNYGTFAKSNKLQTDKENNQEDHYEDNNQDGDDSEDDNRKNMNHNHQLSQQKNKYSKDNTQFTINKQQQEVDYDQTSSKSDSEKSPTEAKPCNCRNSKCLKRYCDCFAAGLYCQAECKCEECHNKPEYEDERQKAIQKKKKRIKDAFQPVIQNNSHIKGCHCKNSHCQKKYCVCHQNGVLCSSLCQCVECENKIESMKKEQSSISNYQVLPPASYLQSPYNNNTLQVSLTAMQQQMVKDSSQAMSNNQFAQQHLQSPYNNNSIQKDNIDVEFPSTIKKDSIGSVSKPYEEDFSTHKKPTKRKALKFSEKQKPLSSFFNEISPADNKYLVNKS
ncbi:hypothetical protein ABPG72_017128 [Tetrahymena utriculariae]